MITLEQILVDDHQNQARAALGILQELRPTAISLFQGPTDDTSQRAAFLSLYVALCGSTGDFTNSQEACADFERWIKA
jgi:hypothetical protein